LETVVSVHYNQGDGCALGTVILEAIPFAGVLMRMNENRRLWKPFDALAGVVSVAAFMLACGRTVSTRAEDWPQWRGPNRDGVWNESGVLESFPGDGLKIRWRSPVGFGWSSPVVSQGRVFVTDAHLAQPAAQERVHCFDEATGKSLWTYAYEVVYPDWAFTPGQEGRPSATPIVEAGKVYALGSSGHVHCLEAITGKLLWERRLEKEYKIAELSCRTSPLIEGDLLILFTGGKPGACVTALEKNSGKEVWRALDESVSNSSPIVIAAGGKRQLIVWTGESVTSLVPATGEVYWRERLVTSNNDNIATPVSEKNWLLISGLMLELRVDEPLAAVVWPKSRAVSRRVLSNTSTPLLRGDYLYSAKSSGELVCLDAHTGQQLWETDKVTGLKSGASIHLTANGDAVFLFTDEGNLIRARLTPQGYQELSRAHLLEPTNPFGGKMLAWVPPAYANRHVFARSDKELVRASLAAEP
jgi:outer membrane protein assembly factor BamB